MVWLSAYLIKTRKVGDCIVVTLPRELVQAQQIGADMFVKITVQKCKNPISDPSKNGCSPGPDESLETA